ncbi:hypothetical protein J8273_2222 [Carpediemonas membranifera]|uniref:Uncharacterized protein n=1 Tax=Carpediemonas membranifera TaxID=201153 RepID=A0A8J6E151_9EUKA|nr:hypothetical protein J8273_2222 [Carpediemonas membranifera]|eukprot:KAG9395889.1 hypothetical protein J8273_2222 [Carpediemonas membranifera]
MSYAYSEGFNDYERNTESQVDDFLTRCSHFLGVGEKASASAIPHSQSYFALKSTASPGKARTRDPLSAKSPRHLDIPSVKRHQPMLGSVATPESPASVCGSEGRISIMPPKSARTVRRACSAAGGSPQQFKASPRTAMDRLPTSSMAFTPTTIHSARRFGESPRPRPRMASPTRANEDVETRQGMLASAHRTQSSPLFKKSELETFDRMAETQLAEARERDLEEAEEVASSAQDDVNIAKEYSDDVANRADDILARLRAIWSGFEARVGQDGEAPPADNSERPPHSEEDCIERMLVVPEVLGDVDVLVDEILVGFDTEAAYRARGARIKAGRKLAVKEKPVKKPDQPIDAYIERIKVLEARAGH